MVPTRTCCGDATTVNYSARAQTKNELSRKIPMTTVYIPWAVRVLGESRASNIFPPTSNHEENRKHSSQEGLVRSSPMYTRLQRS